MFSFTITTANADGRKQQQQQQQQNVPAGHGMKVVVAFMDYVPWLFANGAYKPMDFNIDIGNENDIFSSH